MNISKEEITPIPFEKILEYESYNMSFIKGVIFVLSTNLFVWMVNRKYKRYTEIINLLNNKTP